MNSVTYNQDCLEAMRQMPDKAFDLAIVDPPYGIGGGSNVTLNRYDDKIPTKEYFKELCRVSSEQIIWGGNYFSSLIPFNSTHTIIWDKENGDSFMSDAEIAFTSINKKTTKIYRLFWMSNMMNRDEKPIIHINQKPKSLYKWLLRNYAKPGDTILDTHLGSGSSRIAAYDLGFDFTGYELDSDYFNAQEERFARHIAQPNMFAPEPIQQTQEVLFAAA